MLYIPATAESDSSSLALNCHLNDNVYKVNSRLSQTVCSNEKPVAVVSSICEAEK